MSQFDPQPAQTTPPGYAYVPGSSHPQYTPPGDGTVGVPRGVLIGFFIFALAAVAIIAAAIVIGLTPKPPGPDCEPGQICGGPPDPPGGGPLATPSPSLGPGSSPGSSPEPGSSSPPLNIDKVAANSELGYSVDYSADWWIVEQAEPRDLRLKLAWAAYGDPVLWLHAAPASEKTLEQLMAEQFQTLGEEFVGLTPDTRKENTVTDPEIGYVRGAVSVYAGNVDTPQGPGAPVLVFIEAASYNGLSVSAALIMVGNFTLQVDKHSHGASFRVQADYVLNKFTWPSP